MLPYRIDGYRGVGLDRQLASGKAACRARIDEKGHLLVAFFPPGMEEAFTELHEDAPDFARIVYVHLRAKACSLRTVLRPHARLEGGVCADALFWLACRGFAAQDGFLPVRLLLSSQTAARKTATLLAGEGRWFACGIPAPDIAQRCAWLQARYALVSREACRATTFRGVPPSNIWTGKS